VAVAAQVALADVIAPEDEDVGLSVRHGWEKSDERGQVRLVKGWK